MSEKPKIVVVGAGAFGTALAAVAAATGNAKVTLLARRQETVEECYRARRNDAFLPGIPLPAGLAFSSDAAALMDADIVLFAMPSQEHRAAARSYGARPGDHRRIVGAKLERRRHEAEAVLVAKLLK
ncbi:NAD(P)-binding domain-containing protein, partial [Sinorhizobium sp. 6-117]|uniref:NAD(P)-binding domain-containing protein n=1 Tax=Sinorhizobium sp. 6-117 TaxID=3049090 RepID=UPI0024C2E710